MNIAVWLHSPSAHYRSLRDYGARRYEKNIKKAFTFDKHFEQFGVEVL